MNERIEAIKREICKVVVGKDRIVEKVMTAMIAGGHILLEDIPGVGKTTLALAFSRTMGLDFGRIQFTPDVVPSDITGFTMYDKNTGKFEYKDGAVMCNFFLADEINRTSSKTQSALLEVMQEGKLTVDGEIHMIPKPFVVMATQNPVGTAGTQMLPEAQLDRFMVKMSMGYPDIRAQIDIMKDRAETDPLENVKQVASKEDLMEMQSQAKRVFVDDKIYEFVASLAEATRHHQYIKLGVSPRGALAMCSMAKAEAFVRGRDYAVPEDITDNFIYTCKHRIILHQRAQMAGVDEDMVLTEIADQNKAPKV